MVPTETMENGLAPAPIQRVIMEQQAHIDFVEDMIQQVTRLRGTLNGFPPEKPPKEPKVSTEPQGILNELVDVSNTLKEKLHELNDVVRSLSNLIDP